MSEAPAGGSVSDAIRLARTTGDLRVMLAGGRLDRHILRQLARMFAQRGKARHLVHLLLADDASVIESLDVAAAAFELAVPLGRGDNLRQALERGMRRTGRPLLWQIGFGRALLTQLPPDIRGYLRDLKHAGVPGREAPLTDRATALARNILLPAPLIARLHGASRHGALGRSEWEDRFRFGLALDTLATGWETGAAALLDPARASAILQEALAGPALLLTFHGGFVRMTKRAYDLAAESGARLQSKPARNEEQLSVADTRAALFGALRRLQAGDPMLVAADAPIGRARSEISVLGKRLGVAEGAAFLAHETGSPVFFLTAVWTGDGFEPRLVEGPRAAAGEPFRVFAARLGEFYEEAIEGVLRGDPVDIAIRTLWAGVLSAPE